MTANISNIDDLIRYATSAASEANATVAARRVQLDTKWNALAKPMAFGKVGGVALGAALAGAVWLSLPRKRDHTLHQPPIGKWTAMVDASSERENGQGQTTSL